MTEDAHYKRNQLYSQESKIAELDKMIHGTGHDLRLGDKGRSVRDDIEGVDQLEVLEYLVDI